MKEEREAAKVDRAEMEVKLERKWVEMQAQLEHQRAEMSAETEKLRQEAFETLLREQMPQEVISTEQVVALMTRNEALHATKLLSDDELFVMEHAITDFAEVRATLVW
eukprot:COSAG06_NODE_2007_length_7858_cov_23.947158_7_plen_108_part_00